MSRSRSTSRSEIASPLPVVASIWLVAVVLTGYCATDVHSWVHGSAEREDSPLPAIADALQAAGDATGLSAARGWLERVREGIYKGGEAAAAPAPPQPQPPVVAQPAPAPTADASAAAPTGDGSAAAPIARRHAVQRALVIGASSIQFDLGIALEQELKQRGVVVKRYGRAATGLTQPEILDWAAKLESLLDGFAADTVIINFGGNDALAIKVHRDWIQWGTPKWAEAYGQRVSDLVDRCKRRGATAIVIGMPIMRSAQFSQRMQELNRITRQYTEAAGGVYLSQWEYSTTAEGGYRQYIEVDGQRRLMRNEDGIHYSPWGAAHAARLLVADLEQQFAVGASGAAGPPPDAAAPR